MYMLFLLFIAIIHSEKNQCHFHRGPVDPLPSAAFAAEVGNGDGDGFIRIQATKYSQIIVV